MLVLRSRVALNEITGSVEIFRKVISTIGPPGLNGGIGPITEMIATGSVLKVLIVSMGCDKVLDSGNWLVVAGSAFFEQELIKGNVSRNKHDTNPMVFRCILHLQLIKYSISDK